MAETLIRILKGDEGFNISIEGNIHPIELKSIFRKIILKYNVSKGNLWEMKIDY